MRVMRMLVMFDLPTGNIREKKSYQQFRKFLLNDGYTMEQFSVYSRVLLSRDSEEPHLLRLKLNLPETGAVTVLMLTEKQYANRKILIDTRNRDRQNDPGAQLTLAF